MKTLEAEIILMKMFKFEHNIVVPNLTDITSLARFEADLLVLTKAGYATCIEIKVSENDLKKDLKKEHIARLPLFEKETKDFYYSRLKHFYYAVPEELISSALEQIPPFAGLIDLTKRKIIRNPDKLYNFKWPYEDRVNLLRLGTMRIFNLKYRISLLLKGGDSIEDYIRWEKGKQ